MLLRIDFEGAADMEDLEISTSALRKDLAELPIEEIASVRKSAEVGTRGIDAAEVSALLVSAKPTIDLLTAIVSTIGSWLRRNTLVRTCRLEINGDALDLAGLSEDDLRRYADAWIALHAGS